MDARDRRVAYHEAGHAVASAALGRKIRSVSIEPVEDLAGSVRNSRVRRLHPQALGPGRMRYMVERECLILLAGPAAESLAGYRQRAGMRDWNGSLQLIALISGSVDEQRPYAEWLYQRACTLLRVHWSATQLLARALVERRCLNGRQARALLASVDRPLVPAAAEKPF